MANKPTAIKLKNLKIVGQPKEEATAANNTEKQQSPRGNQSKNKRQTCPILDISSQVGLAQKNKEFLSSLDLIVTPKCKKVDIGEDNDGL